MSTRTIVIMSYIGLFLGLCSTATIPSENTKKGYCRSLNIPKSIWKPYAKEAKVPIKGTIVAYGESLQAEKRCVNVSYIPIAQSLPGIELELKNIGKWITNAGYKRNDSKRVPIDELPLTCYEKGKFYYEVDTIDRNTDPDLDLLFHSQLEAIVLSYSFCVQYKEIRNGIVGEMKALTAPLLQQWFQSREYRNRLPNSVYYREQIPLFDESTTKATRWISAEFLCLESNSDTKSVKNSLPCEKIALKGWDNGFYTDGRGQEEWISKHGNQFIKNNNEIEWTFYPPPNSKQNFETFHHTILVARWPSGD